MTIICDRKCVADSWLVVASGSAVNVVLVNIFVFVVVLTCRDGFPNAR
jgi:hypothetical protein